MRGATKVLLSHRTYFKKKTKSKNQNKKIKKTKHETVSQDKKKKHIATQSLVFLGFVLLGFGSLKRQKKVKNAVPEHRHHVFFTCWL